MLGEGKGSRAPLCARVCRRLREAWASAGTSRVKGDAHTGLMSAEPVTAVDVPTTATGSAGAAAQWSVPIGWSTWVTTPRCTCACGVPTSCTSRLGRSKTRSEVGLAPGLGKGCETSVPRSPAGVAPEPVRRRPAALAGKVPALTTANSHRGPLAGSSPRRESTHARPPVEVRIQHTKASNLGRLPSRNPSSSGPQSEPSRSPDAGGLARVHLLAGRTPVTWRT